MYPTSKHLSPRGSLWPHPRIHPWYVIPTLIKQIHGFSQSKVEKMKSVLVVKKQDGQKENLDKLEQTVVDNNIPLTNSFVNKNGDKVLVCPSVEVRDNLKAHVQTVCPGVSLESPGVRCKNPCKHDISTREAWTDLIFGM